MVKKLRLAFLIFLMAALVFAVGRQSRNFYYSFHRLKAPTHQSRQLSELGIYNYMTIKDLSRRYHVPEDSVFKYLKIKPAPGDDKLSLIQLRRKYGISPDAMREDIRALIEYSKTLR